MAWPFDSNDANDCEMFTKTPHPTMVCLHHPCLIIAMLNRKDIYKSLKSQSTVPKEKKIFDQVKPLTGQTRIVDQSLTSQMSSLMTSKGRVAHKRKAFSFSPYKCPPIRKI